ncbi:hypothetical protein [Roseivirga sp. E12]|uniref:hypothetical protein n=1 Tax=Roseivirga sp. E12 TaxID=2819237 RepID=UPI001ABBF8BA|nr:hypothetical protein [Roseivirga sp. E12]MBO3699015.1 hypothetical protein [Roseivirga sp. E12]
MIRLCFTLLFLGSALVAHAQFDVKQQLEKKIIQDKYVSFLTDKDYSPEVDEDGDVKFKYKERTFYITIDMEDKNFFRLARLANLKLDSESEITKAKNLCHEVTKDAKVAKVYWINGVIWTSSEIVLQEFDDFTSIFDRVLTLTDKAYLKFVKLWKES